MIRVLTLARRPLAVRLVNPALSSSLRSAAARPAAAQRRLLTTEKGLAGKDAKSGGVEPPMTAAEKGQTVGLLGYVPTPLQQSPCSRHGIVAAAAPRRRRRRRPTAPDPATPNPSSPSLAGFAAVCGYFIVGELWQGKASPNTVFDVALDRVKADPRVCTRFGTPLKGYGADRGRNEGRRNFIEHDEYKHKDGSTRCRVKFNVEGPLGKAWVFAEASDNMDRGDLVYVQVQDKRRQNWAVSVVDGRAALAAKLSNDGERNALSKFLSGGDTPPPPGGAAAAGR